MTAKTSHAKMAGHVLMELTIILANALMDTQITVAIQVCRANIWIYLFIYLCHYLSDTFET